MSSHRKPTGHNFRQTGLSLLLVGSCLMALAGEASAAAYTVWLKSGPNQPYQVNGLKCATGSFNFAKGGVGSTPVQVTMNVDAGCITENPAISLSGTADVVVRDITLNGQAQGPNVDGLAGTLTSAEASQSCTYTPGGSNNVKTGTRLLRWRLVFASTAGASNAPGTRTFSLSQDASDCTNNPSLNNNNFTTTTLVSNAPYHLYNATAAAAVPEPETLWLALGGLGALALARRARRKA